MLSRPPPLELCGAKPCIFRLKHLQAPSRTPRLTNGGATNDSFEWLQGGCAVTRRRFPVGTSPTRRFAPAGSNRSSHGGNEMAAVLWSNCRRALVREIRTPRSVGWGMKTSSRRLSW